MESPATVEDLYPSRYGGQAQILPRRDPVVWGQAGPASLSAEQLAFFDKHGYLLFPGFLTAEEVAGLQEEMRRIWDARQHEEADELIREPGSDILRSVFRIHETSAVFSRVCRHRFLLGAAQQILDGDVYIHHSRINYKPGYRGKEFYWHSDFETWHTEDGLPRMRAVSCAVSLTENNEFNGPLMVIPGSQVHYVSCPGRTPEAHFRESLRQQEYGVPDPESLDFLLAHRTADMVSGKGPAGTVLLFDCNVMHGSNSNISPFPRSNLFFVYNSVHNTPAGQAFSGHPPRPEFLRSTDFTPLTPAED